MTEAAGELRELIAAETRVSWIKVFELHRMQKKRALDEKLSIF